MFDALVAGFQAIAADRVMLVIVIGLVVLSAWLVYELVSAGPRRRRKVERPKLEPAPQPSAVASSARVEAVVHSLRERDEVQRRKRRLIKARARNRRRKRAAQ